MNQDKIYNLEMKLWEAAKNRDSQAFLKVVSETAVMVCGGYRCTGKEYAEIIAQFDCETYTIEHFGIVNENDDSVQVHYVVNAEVKDEAKRDMAGLFHVTTTRKTSEVTPRKSFFRERKRLISMLLHTEIK